MKGLLDYVKESLDNDNLFYKLDKWFERDSLGKESFTNLISQCKEDADLLNDESLSNHLDNINFDTIKFVNFMDENVFPDEGTDYVYQVKKIIQLIIGNKNNSYNI